MLTFLKLKIFFVSEKKLGGEKRQKNFEPARNYYLTQVHILIQLSHIGATTFGIMTVSMMTVSIMTVSIMTVSIMTHSIMTVSIMTVSIMTISIMIISK